MTDDEFDPSHPYVRRQGRAGGGRQKGQVMTTNTNAALREKLIDLIAEHLSGTYHCTRVWEAWNVGTMSQDDFEDVGESDTPAELADAILAEISTAAQPPADGALNTIAAMFHSGEEIEGPDGLAMMVDMSVWNDALDAFEGIIGDEMEPAKEQA